MQLGAGVQLGPGVQLSLVGAVRDPYVALTLTHAHSRALRRASRLPSCHCVIIAYERTVRSDDHQAGDAVAPRDARPQRLLLGPEAAVPAVRREAGGGSGEPRAPCGLASPLLERSARVS